MALVQYILKKNIDISLKNKNKKMDPLYCDDEVNYLSVCFVFGSLLPVRVKQALARFTETQLILCKIVRESESGRIQLPCWSCWTCILICMSCLWDGLTDKLTPRRCISRMHAVSQMSRVIDRMPHYQSKRSLLSIYSRGGRTGTECLVSTWSHFGCTIFPPCRPGCVMSWVVVGGVHVTPADIRLSQCRADPALYLGHSALHWGAAPTFSSQLTWMMCLFIVADRCHVRHALSRCEVSFAIFSPQ